MIKIREVTNSEEVEAIRDKVLEIIKELESKYKMVMEDKSGKFKKFRRMENIGRHLVALSYAIVDFLFIPCRCGFYDIEVRIRVPEKDKESGFLFNRYSIRCSRCGVEKGEVTARSGVSIGLIRLPKKRRALVVVHGGSLGEVLQKEMITEYIQDHARELLHAYAREARKNRKKIRAWGKLW